MKYEPSLGLYAYMLNEYSVMKTHMKQYVMKTHMKGPN